MKNLSAAGVVMIALAFCASSTLATNSPEATAAAKRHRAEQRGAGDAIPSSRPAPTTQAPAQPTRAPGPASDWAARLASCKAQAGMNLVKREQCVWSHCNGHWGEGDCPPGSDWPPKFEKPKFEKFGSTPGKPSR